mmetsp:Transcript_28816/g.68799  ORF Transcript_28816/g.68799 Transcript_28816/m.68799 type:complete len:280 (-) Transcript_28816:2374-3213(-)
MISDPLQHTDETEFRCLISGIQAAGYYLIIHCTVCLPGSVRSPFHDSISLVNQWVCLVSKHSVPGHVSNPEPWIVADPTFPVFPGFTVLIVAPLPATDQLPSRCYWNVRSSARSSYGPRCRGARGGAVRSPPGEVVGYIYILALSVETVLLEEAVIADVECVRPASLQRVAARLALRLRRVADGLQRGVLAADTLDHYVSLLAWRLCGSRRLRLLLCGPVLPSREGPSNELEEGALSLKVAVPGTREVCVGAAGRVCCAELLAEGPVDLGDGAERRVGA